MEEFYCAKSTAIKKIKKKNNTRILVVFNKSVIDYEYEIIESYWKELSNFNDKFNGENIKRKINEDIKLDKKIWKIPKNKNKYNDMQW